MKTTIYFYSGTGNSLWTAKQLMQNMNDAQLLPMTNTDKADLTASNKQIGFIFPVHMWGLPRRVIKFIRRLPVDHSAYYFAIAVNAGQVAATLLQLRAIMREKGADLSAGFSLRMPSNYIPWGGAIATEKQQALFAAALDKIKLIDAALQSGKIGPPEQGPSWQNFFLSALYKLGSPRIPQMDKSFWVDGKCTSCGICEKICPTRNITMADGKPVWHHHCEQCLACIQWCPEEAIQYGKNSATKKRYHHPEIKLSDMLNCGK